MPAEGRDEGLLLRFASLPREGPRTKLRVRNVGESAAKAVSLSPRRETEQVRILTETIIMVALSGALYLIKIFTLPQGGSITLGSMVPIFLLALRRGPRIGMIGGVAFGLVALVEDVYSGVEVIFYPAQVILDYPLAFGLLGLAGFFQKIPVLGVGVGIGARFCSHFVSGVLFFASYAPAGVSPFVYSGVYNAGFLIPEFVITAGLMIVLVRVRALELYR
jgi:thiamine transporter